MNVCCLVLISIPFLFNCTTGVCVFSTVTPFNKLALYAAVNAAFAGTIILEVFPLLSFHSAQYTIGPLCKAVLPILSVIRVSDFILLISKGSATVTWSFLFQVRCNIA